MSKKVNKRKFFRPGNLEVPGTKVSIKTVPYLNGVVFNTEDPVTSFRTYMAIINTLIRNYQMMVQIPGMENFIEPGDRLNPTDVNKAKMLIDLLALSPIEILVREQVVTPEILADLEVNNGRDQ
jgi:hypothetical protein